MSFTFFTKQGEMSFVYDDWDSRVYSSAIVENPAGTFRMFYTAYGSDVLNDYGPAMAISTDGLATWSKPIVGEIDYPTVAGDTDNNLVIFRDNDTPIPMEFLDCIWAEGQYLAMVKQKQTQAQQLWKSSDGEAWAFVQNAFTGSGDGEYAEGKCILYDGSTYKLFYRSNPPAQSPARRSLGYYEAATYDGSFVDQGFLTEFTSPDVANQFYDMSAWEHAGAWWACVPFFNSTTQKLGPLTLWRSEDTGESWTRRGLLIDMGESGTFDDELLAGGKPILVNGLWHMMYVGSSEDHGVWPRPMVFAWATSSSLEGPVITWDAPFYQTKSLTPLIGPAGACTRAGTAGYYDSAGLWQYAGANTAAFSHDPATGESFGLSMFTGHTNIAPSPNDLSGWTDTRTTNAQSAGISPDGTNNANAISEDGSNNSHFVTVTGIGSTNSAQHTFSVFLKASNRTWAFLQHYGTPTALSAYFDLVNGVTGAESGIDDAGMDDVGNGWWRCWIKYTTGTVSSDGLLIAPAAGNNLVSYQGLSQESILVWNAQCAVGSFPQPYTATAHNSDEIDWADVSWYNDSAGTWYFKVRVADLSNDRFVLTIGAIASLGSDALSIWFDLPAGTISAFRGTITGDDGFIQMAGVAAVDTWIEIAVAYQDDDMVMYVDGVAGTPDTAVTVPPSSVADNMTIGSNIVGGNTSLLNGYLAHARYDATRLPDPTVQNWSQGKFGNKRAGIGLSMGKMGM